jgi:hypothetical protein
MADRSTFRRRTSTKIEIRPYLKLTEVLTGNIIAEGQIKIIVPVIKN